MINTQSPNSTVNSMAYQHETEKNPVVGALAGGAGIGLVGFGLKTALDAAAYAAISFDTCRSLSYFTPKLCLAPVVIAPATIFVTIATPVIIANVSLVAAKYCFQIANKHL